MIRPLNSYWVPTPRIRRENRERVLRYAPGLFEDYYDYFFFLHIDPVVRFWHVAGMMLGGCVFFPLAALCEGEWAVAFGAIGILFFYGFGYLSHWVYDGLAARTDPRYFLRSTPYIIEINILTITGDFDHRLLRFIERYPFAREAYQLRETALAAPSAVQGEP